MRVVFAHTDFRIYWPGRLKALNSFLAEKGIELIVVEIAGAGSPYDFATAFKDNLSFWHCLFPGRRMEEISAYRANKALRKKLDELQPDIIFSGAIAYSSGAASIRWANENKKRCVIFDNARIEDVPRSRLVNQIKRGIYSVADAVFCPSAAWNDTFRFFGFRDEQIFHGLNVVDNNFWSPKTNASLRGLPERYFLTVGRQIPKKNFLFLLRAYLMYFRASPNPASLVLVGDGPKRKILENFARENNLHSVILFSFSSQEELRAIYKGAICFILPSRYGETWGLVVNEAMASGLPVLVSDQVGCASTLVREGDNGFIFSPDDSERLADLMIRFDQMPDAQRNKMGLTSMDIISQWGHDRFISGVSDALQFVMKSAPRKPGIMIRILIRIWKGRYRPL